MTPDLYLLASEAPGVLDDSPLRVEVEVCSGGKLYVDGQDPPELDYEWHPAVWLGDGWVVKDSGIAADYGTDDSDESRAWIRLPLSRPEVRDRLVRWGMEHDRRPPNPVRMKSEYLWPWLRDSPPRPARGGQGGGGHPPGVVW